MRSGISLWRLRSGNLCLRIRRNSYGHESRSSAYAPSHIVRCAKEKDAAGRPWRRSDQSSQSVGLREQHRGRKCHAGCGQPQSARSVCCPGQYMRTMWRTMGPKPRRKCCRPEEMMRPNVRYTSPMPMPGSMRCAATPTGRREASRAKLRANEIPQVRRAPSAPESTGRRAQTTPSRHRADGPFAARVARPIGPCACGYATAITGPSASPRREVISSVTARCASRPVRHRRHCTITPIRAASPPTW